MPESHTGESIAAVLLEAVEEWCIPTDPPLVTDNASNMEAAAREAQLSIHIGCFAHVLNLACGRALKLANVHRLLGRVRRIVGYFHRSALANTILKEKQKTLALKEHKLIQDVQTRWNSAVDMIERFLEQQPAVYATLTSKEMRSRDKQNVATLSQEDFGDLEDLIEILKPLKTATTALCEEKVPTISIVLPLKHQLLTNILCVQDGDKKLVKSAKEAVAEDLKKRYETERQQSALIMASLLDPRFKSLPFLKPIEKRKAFSSLEEEVLNCIERNEARAARLMKIKQEPAEDATSTTSSVPPLPEVPATETEASPDRKRIKTEDDNSANSGAMSALFGDVYITKVESAVPQAVEEKVADEIKMYKLENPIPLTNNPLLWWKECGEHKYPSLAIAAKKFLSIPATSVPSERVFSTAGDIVTAQRSALKSTHVDKLIFLKKNWKPV